MEHETQYHYQVIKRALDIIDEAPSPLSLDALAQKMGMSPSHFQKTFRNWVGVSPKKYQSYLTLSHAKSLLRNRHSTLRTSHEAGLSGSGRLHDLFVTWEAMTPGEYAQKGRGLTISHACVDTPFGPALLMATARGLCGIGFIDDCGYEHAFKDLSERWPEAHYVENITEIAPYRDLCFTSHAPLKLHLMGTSLQIKVWEALLSIPSGHVSTYSDIATHIGKPTAQRAVGTAVGRNPISWVIPCHRALRKSGALGGYHWGLTTKRAMLAYESAQRDVLAKCNTLEGE
ncbi:MAG: methylated-DNA--[protein]-cysteine S-methyltransferase [Halocynthiibacter sp.]